MIEEMQHNINKLVTNPEETKYLFLNEETMETLMNKLQLNFPLIFIEASEGTQVQGLQK